MVLYWKENGSEIWSEVARASKVNSLTGEIEFNNIRWLGQFAIGFDNSVVSVDNEIEIPNSLKLTQNYPNPFNPSTAINYSVPKETKIKLKIYDILGREVAELVNERKQVGNYTAFWHSKDDKGNRVSSGIYIYRLITEENKTLTRKMILMK